VEHVDIGQDFFVRFVSFVTQDFVFRWARQSGIVNVLPENVI
jgi:hypothetical protein